jgi:hypothetical protein
MYGIQGHTLRHFEENPVFDMEQIKTSTANNLHVCLHVCGTFLSFVLLTKPTAWVQCNTG